MGFFGLILKWDFISLEQSFQIHSYISVLGLNSHQFTFHVFNRWGCFAAHLLLGVSTVTGLFWVMATQDLACTGPMAALWDRAERRRELTLPSLGTFGPNMLQHFEETATASIFFQQVKGQNIS